MPKKNDNLIIAPEINKLIKVLCNPQLNIAQIARETGLPAAWMRKFQAGLIADPSYTKIKILKEFFNI